MTRLLTRPRHVAGWVDGIVELAEPDRTDPNAGGVLSGRLDAANDLVPTEAGRLAVRGGSARVQTFHGLGGSAVTAVLAVVPFSPAGLVAVTWHAGENAHYVTRLTVAGAFLTGAEATSRSLLGWSGSGPARVVAVELFEKLFLADARPGAAARYPLTALTSGGFVSSTSYDLDGAGGTPAAPLRAAGVAHWNSFLFAWGWDSEAAPGGAPHLLRHSLLGTDPAAATGWDKDAYAIIGEVGKPITAACGGPRALLVAKADGLYRVSGNGSARPGWQFAIQPVDPTSGAGVISPQGLCYDGGHWYGIGPQGPFRTDGDTVDALVGPRRRSWAQVDQLDGAWVASHPERGLVLFGMHGTDYAARGRSASAPFVLWAWDRQRDVWAPDLRFPYDLGGVAVAQTAVGAGPTAIPGPPVPNHPSATTSSVRADFAAGDPTALTEVWARYEGGGSVLVQTLPPAAGTQAAIIGGRLPTRRVFVKLRHTKGGVASGFTAEATCYTRLAPPSVTVAGVSQTAVDLTIAQAAETVSRLRITVEPPLGGDIHTAQVGGPPDVPVGTSYCTVGGLFVDSDYAATAGAERDDWPAPLQQSDLAPWAPFHTLPPDAPPPGDDF